MWVLAFYGLAQDEGFALDGKDLQANVITVMKQTRYHLRGAVLKPPSIVPRVHPTPTMIHASAISFLTIGLQEEGL